MQLRIKFGHIIFIIAVILLNSCERKGCIPADTVGNDFVITISAKPDDKDFNSDVGEYGGGHITVPQTTRWIDTGFLANGEDIIAKISGQYSSWMGLDEDVDVRDQDLTADRICSPIDGIDRIGEYDEVGYKKPKDSINNNGPKTEHYKKAKAYYDEMINNDKGEDQIERAKRDLSIAKGDKYGLPCWNINGYGLYILLRDPDNPSSPNNILYEMNNPNHPHAHMYYTLDDNGYGQYDSSKEGFFDNKGTTQKIKRKSRIYLRIEDNYYSDNIGEFEVRFQHGVMADDDKFKLFDFISRQIRDTLEYITQKLFKQILNKPGYKSFILACLTLYIALSALSYLLGMAQLNVGDVLMRIVKIAIITMFLSPDAWDFFTSHLLNFYLHGIDEIIGLVGSHANPQGGYNPDSPFNFLDRFFIGFFSEDVWIKIGSMFAIDIVAFVWVLLIMFMILMFLYVCGYALLIYLTSVTVIAIVIIVMPFIFVTMLFPTLKPMIDGWFSILLSYSLQAIMTFLLVSIFIALLTVELYKSIGFPACKNKIAEISILSGIIGKPESFTPGHDYLDWRWDLLPFFDVARAGVEGEEVDGTTGTAFLANWVVGGGQYNNKMITIKDNKSVIRVPPYNDIREERYIYLPFLDPNNKADAARIKNIFEKGQILDLGGTAVAVLICYTMLVLRRAILEISQHLSGASMLSGLAGDAKWAANLAGLPGMGFGMLGNKIAEGLHLDTLHKYTSRLTSPLSGGKTVDAISNKMMKDHQTYKYVNMMRDGIGVRLDTAHRFLSAPNKLLPKAIEMGDVKLYTSKNIDTSKFTDHFGILKPKNFKEAITDNLDYMYEDKVFGNRSSVVEKWIAEKKSSLFKKAINEKIEKNKKEESDEDNCGKQRNDVSDVIKEIEQDIEQNDIRRVEDIEQDIEQNDIRRVEDGFNIDDNDRAENIEEHFRPGADSNALDPDYEGADPHPDYPESEHPAADYGDVDSQVDDNNGGNEVDRSSNASNQSQERLTNNSQQNNSNTANNNNNNVVDNDSNNGNDDVSNDGRRGQGAD